MVDGVDPISAIINLSPGWNFVSLNLEASGGGDGMRLNSVFASPRDPAAGSFGIGDHIKNQLLFADYYDGFGFFGGLSLISTDEMYAVKVAGAVVLTVTGTPVALPKTISLGTGWNYLPCPYQASIGLADGVPTFSYTNGDLIKSQTQFAELYEGFGFFGTLTTMDPGSGYKVRVSKSGRAVFTNSV